MNAVNGVQLSILILLVVDLTNLDIETQINDNVIACHSDYDEAG